MHNTCVRSSFSLRYKGSPSFSFNDYSSCSSDRFERHHLLNSASLSSQCCACCCSNSLYGRVPILKPSWFYGSRQSTLIQWSPYKRLILNGLDRCPASRFLVSDVGRSFCYCENYDLNESKLCGRRGKLGRGRYRCMVFEEESERHALCGGAAGGVADEAEVVLSLLTENVSDEYFCVRERREKLCRKIDVEKRGNSRGNNSGIQKKSAESGGSESTLKFKYQAKVARSSDGKSSKEDIRTRDDKGIVLSNQRGRVKKEERGNWLGENSSETARKEEREILWRDNQRLREEEHESLSRQENHRQKVRKDGSSCSSYYSFSSGEFELDDDIQVQPDPFKDGLSSGYRKDSKKRQEMVSEEDFERHSNPMDYGTILSMENNKAGFTGASSAVENIWRKKSEKKLTDASVDKTQYSKDSAQNLSMYREDKESSYGKAFGSYSRSDDRNKKSSLSNIDERGEQQTRQISETGTKMKYKEFSEISNAYNADLETSFASHKPHGSREENTSISTSSVCVATEHNLTAGQMQREEEYRGSALEFADASKVQKLDSRRTSSAERRSSIRTNDLEDHSTRIQCSIHDMEEQQRQSIQSSSMMDSRIKDQKLTTDVNKERTPVSQTESESRMRQEEVNVYNSHLEARKHQQETNLRHVNTVASRKGSQEIIDMSLPSTSDVRVSFVEDRNSRKSEVVMTTPLSHSAATSSLLAESASRLRNEETVDDRLKSGSSATSGLRIEEIVDENLQNRSTSLHHHTLDKTRTLHETKGDESRGQPAKLVYHEDALGSADRQQKSSAKYVDEFVQEVKSEISSSEIEKAKDTYKAKLLSKEKQHTQASHGSEVSEPKEQDSRRSSQGSAMKGPSDEMWDVTVPTIQEPPKAEAVVAESTTENAVARRSGKSLWNILTDIVRFHWASRSENRTSPSKSAGKSSPNQSTSSETWFSGHEQESNDLNAQNDRISLTQEAISIERQQEQQISSSQVDASFSSNSKGDTKHDGASASTSSVVVQRDSSLQATSLPSNKASSETKYKATFLVAEGARLSPQMPSLPVEKILATGETEGSSSGAIVQVAQSVAMVSSNNSSAESRNEELKRRKLQRTDQVQKDRFDEWEEAYRLETEQRKMDEMFMREALLEAKKAADSWEVPVGAVLVHDGKIIARGYNLVEELRDSTAHAEMICIRQASNNLRTWRLSETTLYVTLEPCPMCAGAILQARIDNVVWGAPNKLLGADGSWIRLFPNGDGGNELESADKPAAPVHPFHPKIVIRRGILSSECADTMQQFFQLRRKKKEKKTQEPPTPPSCLPISHHPSKFLTKMHDAFHFMFCL